MGIFDKILLASDIDGTFSTADPSVAASNAEAIRRFTREGGKFAFATGRDKSHLDKMGFSALVNAPVCLYNGAMIYDFEKGAPVFTERLGLTVAGAIDILKKSGMDIDSIHGYFYEDGIDSYTLIKEDESKNDLRHPLKLVMVFSSPEKALEFKAWAESEKELCGIYVSRSWTTGVEFNSVTATKGTSVRKIKDIVGKARTLVAVGDYENDLSMLELADLPVAVGNAVEPLKNIAKIITPSATDCALIHLISKLEIMINEGLIR
jgi:Cof subfamily protein (haloacid dehalogenase superfamily)